MASATRTSTILNTDGKPFVVSQSSGRSVALRSRYDAAQTSSNNKKHWSAADLLSAREANSPQVRQILRSRSRYECHEANSFACGIVGTLSHDIIGRGPRLQVEMPEGSNKAERQANAKAKAAIEAAWSRWAKRVNLAGKLQTGCKSMVVDGESFISQATNSRLRDEVKLDLMLTEAEQIAAPWGIGDRYENPNYVDGIMLDEYGYPQTYHRLKAHPGDLFRAGLAGEKTDIDADDMIHLFRVDRPGQYRGVPWLTTSLPLFAILRRYTLAVLAAAESVSAFGGVIYTDSPQASPASVDSMDEIELEMRSFLTLPEGWKMGQLKAEQPTTVYEMFRNAVMMEIARCVHMPLNKAIGSSAGYNYSSGRLDHQTYFSSISVIRHQFEIACLDRIVDWWLDEALLVPNYLPPMPAMPHGISHTWIWDEPEHVDPAKVASATQILWNLGLISDEEYQMGRGVDPDEHDRRMARMIERRTRLGLPLPGGTTTAPPAAKDQQDPEDDSEDPIEDDVAEEQDAAA